MILLVLQACDAHRPNNNNLSKKVEARVHISPDQAFGELFEKVQMQKVFEDGKTFVDCTPKFSTEEILESYEAQKKQPNFDLKKFVLAHFELPKKYATGFKGDTTRSAEEHIMALWDILTRQPEAPQNSLIVLPKPYIVPGGRFGEIYYWDSYFTMLGLQVSKREDLIENMLDNFAYLIDTVGFIPNGNRTYYLGRSQPPFFAAMVNLLAESKGEEVYNRYLKTLQKEYDFWMLGTEKLNEKNRAEKRVVRMPDGSMLNRYWDNFDTPRPESYKEDVETVEKHKKEAAPTYRNLRAGAESGWDFSSRWFADAQNLHSIETVNIIPIDLNCLLYNLENTLAKAYQFQKNLEKQNLYTQKAQARKKAILQYCWSEEAAFFMDYHWQQKQLTEVPSLAGVYPLAFKIASEEQAKKVAQKIEKDFLKAGGLLTTLNYTGQQWDAPNGWAPLQWMTIWGLRNYQLNELAEKIKTNWVNLNLKVYKNTGKMVEKYNVEDLSLEAGGGEYPVQDGFGWTNGVLLKLLKEK